MSPLIRRIYNKPIYPKTLAKRSLFYDIQNRNKKQERLEEKQNKKKYKLPGPQGDIMRVIEKMRIQREKRRRGPKSVAKYQLQLQEITTEFEKI